MPLSLSSRRAAPTANLRASRAGALPEQTGSARDAEHPIVAAAPQPNPEAATVVAPLRLRRRGGRTHDGGRGDGTLRARAGDDAADVDPPRRRESRGLAAGTGRRARWPRPSMAAARFTRRPDGRAAAAGKPTTPPPRGLPRSRIGPAWDQHHPTWVPVPATEAFDKANSNGRKGMPLRLGYATVIHKSQGMSIGDGKPIERMRLCLSSAITMEASNLGLLYVALSRVEEDSFMVLVEPIDQRRVLYVNSHPGMPARRAEEERLRTLSAETEARAAAAGLDYAALLRELDATCADGVTDAPAPAGP